MSPNQPINSPRREKRAKEEHGSFKQLKCLISSTPILVQLNQDAPFRLETDASGYTTGQFCPN